jgi:prepilin-type N-terminal cleavage/methylation domain-containing protein
MKSRRKCRYGVAGYSLVEMMMTLAIGLIMVAVALPTMVGAIQSYRLNSASQQLASLIELTRYTASPQRGGDEPANENHGRRHLLFCRFEWRHKPGCQRSDDDFAQ